MHHIRKKQEADKETKLLEEIKEIEENILLIMKTLKVRGMNYTT